MHPLLTVTQRSNDSGLAGVWFTSNANKGSLMRAVLQPGMHVVFADDSARHLVAANAALEGLAASVSCLHFTAATSAASQNLNSANCDQQLAKHVAELFAEGDPIVVKLVQEREPFVHRFLTEQIQSQSEPLTPSFEQLAKALQ